MKKTILLLLFPLAILPAIAQKNNTSEKKFQLGFGVGAGIFTGTGSESSVISASAELQGEGKLSQGFSLYSQLAYNRIFGGGASAGYGSLLAGPRAWFSQRIFIGFGAGFAYFTGGGESDAVFNYNPHIGVSVKKTQFTLGYNGLTDQGENIGAIQLRAIVKL